MIIHSCSSDPSERAQKYLEWVWRGSRSPDEGNEMCVGCVKRTKLNPFPRARPTPTRDVRLCSIPVSWPSIVPFLSTCELTKHVPIRARPFKSTSSPRICARAQRHIVSQQVKTFFPPLSQLLTDTLNLSVCVFRVLAPASLFLFLCLSM